MWRDRVRSELLCATDTQRTRLSRTPSGLTQRSAGLRCRCRPGRRRHRTPRRAARPGARPQLRSSCSRSAREPHTSGGAGRARGAVPRGSPGGRSGREERDTSPSREQPPLRPAPRGSAATEAAGKERDLPRDEQAAPSRVGSGPSPRWGHAVPGPWGRRSPSAGTGGGRGRGPRGDSRGGRLTHADAATRRSFACCRLSPTAPPRPIPALDGSHRPDQWDCRPEEGVLLLAGRRRGPPRAAAGGARGATGGPAGSGLCGHSAGAGAGPGRGACCLGLVMDIVWWGTRGPRSASAVRAVSGSSGPPRRARPGRSLRGRGRCVP